MAIAKKKRGAKPVGGRKVAASTLEGDAKMRKPGRPPKGFQKIPFKLAEHQIRALRSEAFRRAEERGSGAPDASEVLREILDAWIGKR